MGCTESTPPEDTSVNMPMPYKEVKKGGFGGGQFIAKNVRTLNDVYALEQKDLGSGSYGTVCPATHKATKALRAVKSISKATLKNVWRFRQEIAIMKMMDHPNIIKLHETFEDQKNIYLVLEIANGQEMFDRIVEMKSFAENQAAIIMRQILRAVAYMHESQVCHRDLKPENFLFMTKGPVDEAPLKVIDFGLSCSFKDKEFLTTKAGTPYYVAPEVLMGKYNQISDLWSCGVILYVLLCGYPPFYGNNDAQIMARVKLGKYVFHAKNWDSKSDGAKALITGLLIKDYTERFPACKALNDVWITQTTPKAEDITPQPDLVDNLRRFMSMNKLKKAALHIIAGQLDNAEIKDLGDLFLELDANGDGLLTRQELVDGLGRVTTKEVPVDLQNIIDSIDCDGSGVVDYTEFLAAAMDKRNCMQRDICWSAFCVLDKDGDGKVSREELKGILLDDDVKDVSESGTFVRVMAEYDKDQDGGIDFEEFMLLMTDNGGEAAISSMSFSLSGR